MISMIKTVIAIGLEIFFLLSCRPADRPASPLRLALKPLPGRVMSQGDRVIIESPAVLSDPDLFVWGGSVVKGEDGRYHMFYSVFDSGPDRPPFQDAWLLSSKIAYAVSEHPDRGFVFQKIILQGAASEGRTEAWDAQMVHNPHLRKFGGIYYLYYIGSRDPGPQPEGSPGAGLRKRDRIQQVQKIGVITSRTIHGLVQGDFVRPSTPLLVPRTRVKARDVIAPSSPGTAAKPDNLIVVNPSVSYRPEDRKYLLFFKGNLYDPTWRGVHGVAVAASPAGPYEARDEFVFDVRIADGRIASAEDPYVWNHRGSQRFYAVIKDFTGRITRAEPGLALMMSSDGIDWEFPADPLFSRKRLRFEDGTVLTLAHLERPQMLIDPQGIPQALYAACSIEPVGGKTDGSTFNVQFTVQVREESD
jgi:hypothetical protein